ncbi:MAG: type III polyketide synthase [Acidobacteriota bacterium]
MQIAAVGRSFPENYYEQDTLIAALKKLWSGRHYNLERLESLHRNVLVGGRHLALPLEGYQKLRSFTDANDAFIRCAVELGERAIKDGLKAAGLEPGDIDHLFFVSTTGIATPSIDAHFINRLPLRADVKRTPLFGLGCVGGAAGVARATDYLRAYPSQVAVLVSVELCSLTLQREDLSIANIIASGLFGDGAAAVVLMGEQRQRSASSVAGPRVLTSRSVFYPHTERVMGWDITREGFRIVLSADVPRVVQERTRSDVDRFLADEGLSLDDISTFVCHPGGPKVLQAFQEALGLPAEALSITWDSLRRDGNMSSASVLMVLRETMMEHCPRAGSYGLMIAMGPGFCSELVLLQW